MKVDVVILAGGDGAVIDPTCRFKGLLPVAGRPMVEWVVDAVREATSAAEVAVVVPTAADLGDWVDKVDKLVVSDDRITRNILAGVRAFPGEHPLLFITGDIPALTGHAIDDYVARTEASGSEITYPLITKQDMLEQFPGSERTFVKLRDGHVTGGNMIFLTRPLIERNLEIGQKLFDTRKSALQMARVIGFRWVLKMATGRLEVPDVEAKLAELLGGRASAIYTPEASIGADVDKPIDVVIAERVLYARR